MELRSAEQELNEIKDLYETLRRADATMGQKLPALSSSSDPPSQNVDDDPSSSPETTLMTAKQVLDLSLSIRERLLGNERGLESKMVKFRERLKQIDPVTEKPRYGATTQARVEALLAMYQELKQNMDIVFGGCDVDESSSSNATNQNPNESNQRIKSVVDGLRQQVEQEEEEARQKQLEETMRLEQEEAERRAAKERQLEERRRAEEEARLQAERERLELARQAEEARQARERAQQEAAQADQEWVNSIAKGPDGVREQLSVLLESAAGDPEAQSIAITALHTIFSQIVAHPEEVNFRRIRRDHPRFNQDIGRHRGGKEILIAAGFELGAIDDIPSFISKEPSIEKDMDRWSSWFDLLKATLEIIEEQLMK